MCRSLCLNLSCLLDLCSAHLLCFSFFILSFFTCSVFKFKDMPNTVGCIGHLFLNFD